MADTTGTSERGLLFVMVGAGGAGKNTLLQIALDHLNSLKELVTVTTRPMRAEEQNGIDYQFVDMDQFHNMIERGDLIEHQEVTKGKFYGIPRATVDDNLDSGQDLIADIEVLGARILRDTYPADTIMIFVTVPGQTEDEVLDTLRQRMEIRKDSLALIEERLQRARTLELPFKAESDYIIVNDDIERASKELIDIIQQERIARHHPSRVTS